MSEEIKKYLKNSIDEKGNYCYSLPVETTKAVIKELNRLNNIINKAIEYIENEKNKQTSVGVYTKDIHKNLLKILKGDE